MLEAAAASTTRVDAIEGEGLRWAELAYTPGTCTWTAADEGASVNVLVLIGRTVEQVPVPVPVASLHGEGHSLHGGFRIWQYCEISRPAVRGASWRSCL